MNACYCRVAGCSAQSYGKWKKRAHLKANHQGSSPCVLHRDSGDAVVEGGTPLFYVPAYRSTLAAAQGMPSQHLVVFQDREGGRGARYRNDIPGFACTVRFNQQEQLHTNVVCTDGKGKACRVPDADIHNRSLLRVVPVFNLGVQRWLNRVDEAEEKAEGGGLELMQQWAVGAEPCERACLSGQI